MPLGDPHGGNFVYTDEGLPKGVAAVTIPARDVSRSVRFYKDLLGMSLIVSDDDRAVLKIGGSYVILKKSQSVGIDTGLYLTTDSPYDLHRRLIDEGVIFIVDPKKTELGLLTKFKDDDGNIINALEIQT